MNAEALRSPVECANEHRALESWRDYLERSPLPFEGVHHKNVIKVDRHGSVFWNDAHLTAQHGAMPFVEAYLEAVATLDPRPPTILNVQAGAPCEMIDAVYEVMERRLKCRTDGGCLLSDGAE